MTYAFTKSEQERLVAVCLFMNRELHRKIAMPEIYRVAGMNRNKLNAAFKQLYGKTLRTYLMEQKMQKAKELLNDTSLELWQVAEKTGYQHYSNFLTRYKKYYGYPPSQEKRNQPR